MNNIPVARKLFTAYLLGWHWENLYKEIDVKERKAEDEILLEKEEDVKNRHLKNISVSALLLTSTLLQIYSQVFH